MLVITKSVKKKPPALGIIYQGGSYGVCPLLSSRAEEFHLHALPEPCMNLAIHTAPDVRPLP